MAIHLWWDGYSQAPGATAEEAARWLEQEGGEPVDPGDMEQIEDDELMREEDGTISEPHETAAECAAAMLAQSPLRATQTEEE